MANYTHIYIYIYDRVIGLLSKVFANGPGDRGSITGRVIRKNQKMVLDSALLNIIIMLHRYLWPSLTTSPYRPSLPADPLGYILYLNRAGRPAFARPCEGAHKSTSLMSLFLLLQQCPTCPVHIILIVFMMGGRWPYSCCFVGCCFQILFNIARSIIELRAILLNTQYFKVRRSRVKWSNPLNGVAPSSTSQCSSYGNGSFWVEGHQLYFYLYIYIYIYIYIYRESKNDEKIHIGSTKLPEKKNYNHRLSFSNKK